ncbi:MFNG [Bugula neritina]|uniref:MFNG n=1 Tax=Bugula neritina TaxID=10212 RepID=A0A7J7JDT3_BUGNE|nr:MFNG [Bugula neritina]
MCKLQVMYDLYMSKIEQYKWFCSVDDDTYINIPNFVKMLREYDHDKDWYIGKPSLNHIYSVMEHKKKKISYWFATGGAALCISRALAKRMMPLCGNGEFIKRGEAINNPDDTVIGYVCNYLLGVPLTSIPEMHSHLEPMWQIDPLDYHKQISISWGEVVASKVIIIPNRLLIRDEIPQFPVSIDPTRAYTFHCHLFPKSDSCRKIQDRLGALPDA